MILVASLGKKDRHGLECLESMNQKKRVPSVSIVLQRLSLYALSIFTIRGTVFPFIFILPLKSHTFHSIEESNPLCQTLQPDVQFLIKDNQKIFLCHSPEVIFYRTVTDKHLSL